MSISVQVVTGGHPFEAEAFFEIFDSLEDIEWSGVRTPSVGSDVIVFYDMPGLRFTGTEPPVEFSHPSDEVLEVFDRLRRTGTGMVFMHHAVASWPTWEGFAEMVGARFHYQPGALRGIHYPDSGYLFDVRHTVHVLDPHHPICAGLPPTFEITDELYCFPVLEDSVEPLLRTGFPVDDASHFHSADLAIRGRRNANEGWSHPPGSDLLGWVKKAGNSPLAYLQFGDGPVTYADPNFRLVLANAIRWAASAENRSGPT
ncbi:MAG: ThuA domain-containing protein [Ilumatobacteraceae bacterium]